VQVFIFSECYLTPVTVTVKYVQLARTTQICIQQPYNTNSLWTILQNFCSIRHP